MAGGSRGFTLLEMVVSLVLLSILLGIGTGTLVNGVKTYALTTSIIEANSQVGFAVERIGRELREIRRNPLDQTKYDIQVMSPSQVTFTKFDGTKVTIKLKAGNEVAMTYSTIAGLEARLSSTGGGIEFNYLTSDGAVAVGAADVASVEFKFSVVVNGSIYKQSATVALRG